MDLKGAEIRNILEMCMNIGTKNRVPLNVKIPYYQRPYRWDCLLYKSDAAYE